MKGGESPSKASAMPKPVTGNWDWGLFLISIILSPFHDCSISQADFIINGQNVKTNLLWDWPYWKITTHHSDYFSQWKNKAREMLKVWFSLNRWHSLMLNAEVSLSHFWCFSPFPILLVINKRWKNTCNFTANKHAKQWDIILSNR